MRVYREHDSVILENQATGKASNFIAELDSDNISIYNKTTQMYEVSNMIWSDIKDINNASLSDALSTKSYLDSMFTSEELPVSIAEMKPFSDAQGFRARFHGFNGIALAGQVTNLDHTLTEERFINGIRIIAKDHVFGDKISFQVVDKDYSFAGVLYPSEPAPGVPWSAVMPDGVVLDEFGKDWFLAEDQQCQPDVVTPYPARIYAGMTIRMAYTSIGQSDVKVNLNLYLHWKAE